MSDTNKYAFGMIGLGTMGRSLLLNMAVEKDGKLEIPENCNRNKREDKRL